MEDGIELRVLVGKKSSGRWIAHCVDYDIVAQANTLDDLAYEFMRMVMAHIVTCLEYGETPFEKLPPAPQAVRDAFRRSHKLDLDLPRFISDPTPEHPFHVPKAEVSYYDYRPVVC